MDERPLFSIIVPVYNAIEFVGDTIHNLLRQDVNKEILLINDGSTDDSLQLIKQYERKYDCLKVVDKKNGGVSSARNVGLNVAKGDYVIFVDSDDFIDDGFDISARQLHLKNRVSWHIFFHDASSNSLSESSDCMK